jgi:hypothetical protein
MNKRLKKLSDLIPKKINFLVIWQFNFEKSFVELFKEGSVNSKVSKNFK